MAEPQSMSRADVLVSLRDYALVLRECDRAMAWQVADRLDALAAAVAGWQLNDGLASRDEARRADKSTRAKDVIQ